MDMRRRRLATVLCGVGAVAAGWFSGAWGCVSPATLNLSPNSGPAGARITATGRDFSAVVPVTPVVLRWNGTDGPELARVVPGSKGEITATFTVPPAVPGFYVVVAVQRDAAGVDRYGTPARATYQVTGAGAPAPVTTVAPPTTVRLPTPTTSTSTSTTTTVAPATTSTGPPTTQGSVVAAAATPVAPGDELPAPAVALAVLLVLAVGVALRAQAGRR